MKRIGKSWVSLGVGIAGLALYPVSPIAAVAVTAVGSAMAMFAAMGFNVFAARSMQQANAVCFAIAAYLMGGSTFGLAALLAAVATWSPGETLVLKTSGIVATIVRIVFGVAAFVTFAIAWPFGWSALAVLPTVLLTAISTFFAVSGLPELIKNRVPKVALRVSEPAPEFVLPRRSGDGEFRLADERGRHVLVCFLRGDWCPVCQVLMRLYRKASHVLAEHKAKLVMINPSSGEEARSFTAEMGLDYEILVDADVALAKKIGIVSDGKGMGGKPYPLPVSFLVDPQGIVRFISGLDDASYLTPEKIKELLTTTSSPARAEA